MIKARWLMTKHLCDVAKLVLCLYSLLPFVVFLFPGIIGVFLILRFFAIVGIFPLDDAASWD
jgi:hypothetical protein